MASDNPPRSTPDPARSAVHGGEPRTKAGQRDHHADHADGDLHLRRHRRRSPTTSKAASSARSTAATATRRSASPSSKLAALEGAEDGLLFASGMAAITTTLFAMLSKGAHVVVTDDAYRRTRQFLHQILRRYGVEVSTVPAGDYERLEEAIRQTTRLIFSESPTNPYNRILDLERVADIGRRHRVKTIIDSTFATPINQRPARVRHRPGHPLGHQVPRRPQRPARRRGARQRGPGARHPRSARHHRRGARSVRRLPADPRHQDAGAARRAPERERRSASPRSSTRTRRSSASTIPACRAIRSTPSPCARCSGFGGVVSFEVRGDLAAGIAPGRRLPHPAHRPVARRRREPDRAAGADELLRAQHRGTACRSASRTR